MVLYALSFQGQVEKYGVYVGIAAFFGLAVLSLLYFSQARELKRLREWAGRAPERAQELEQRVVAEAAANVARREPAVPGAAGAIAPPRRLAEMPAPPAAQTAAGAQATELAEAVEADPATNGNVPAAPAEGAGNGAAPPAEGEVGEHEAGDGEAAQAEPPEGEQAADAEAATVAGAPSGDGKPAASTADGDEGRAPTGADEPAAAAAPPTGGEETPATASGDRDPAAAAETTGSEEIPAAATTPGEVPAAMPRATPAQRVGVTPRPAPMPLRQTKPTAAPASRGGTRRPGAAPAGRRGAGAPREGRSAGTVALLVGLAVLILGGGAFAISQLGGDDAAPEPNRAAPPPTQTEAGDGGGADAAAKSPAETNVAVLNGTTFTGLAGQIADTVARDGGFQRGATETNTRDQTIQSSTVFYADGFRSQARTIAELLSISAVEPIDDETQALTPEADVVVLAGADQTP